MSASSFHFLTAVLFVGVGLASAAVVNLSGTVYDKDNKPLPGVIVSLVKGGLADTTGADGKWALAGNSTGISRIRQNPSARWDGKVLRLSLVSPATVQVESFDARGARLGTLALARLEAGNHSLPVGSARSATGMRWLRLSVDDKRQVIATGGGFRFDQALPASLARSAEDSVDQLIYMLQGQLITADTVRTLIQSGVEKWVQEFSVSGKATADARVSVDSVFAWFDGGRMAGMRRGRLGFNKANSAYSGRIYTVKSLTGDIFNYRVWLNVMGNGNKRTGISDTTDFSSDFGAIDFIPLFATGNAIPSGSIVGPVTGLVNTNLTFKLALDRKDEQLAHVEWNLADGKSFQTGMDTITGRWLQPGSYGVQARLTDIDSNVAVLTKTVNISNIGSVVAGLRDTTITPSDVVVFSMTAHDTDGVAKVLWNFGDGKTDSTFTGLAHSVSHKYPGTDSVKAGTSRVYTLTVTAVDKLGNTTLQTASIKVVNDVPTVSIHDTVGEPNSLLTLHAISKDLGTITKLEWSVNGAEFMIGGRDTTILLPSNPTLNYPVAVRVTDEDGNISAVNTAEIIIGNMIADVRDGQRYRIVTIGSQTWFAENLKYSGSVGTNGIRTFSTGWCYGNGYPDTSDHSDSETCQSGYGRLYNWLQAMLAPDSCATKDCYELVAGKGICPTGWRIPSSSDWDTLINALAHSSNSDQAEVGALIKSSRSDFDSAWNNDFNKGDLFGFSAIPSGYRHMDLGWAPVNWPKDRGVLATFWSSTPTGFSYYKYHYSLTSTSPSLTKYGQAPTYVRSIRCIQE